VAAAFRRNLEVTVRTGLSGGAGVALCTVPVNLKDCAPFGDPAGRATAAYRRAATNLALGATADALRDFERARDLDAFRFRADSTLQGVVHTVADGFAAQRVALVDAEAAFRRASADGIPGADLFVDHVHPTALGNYVLAAEACRAVERLVGLEGGGTMPAAEECAAALAHTPWDECQVADIVYARRARPPFTGQDGHEERLRTLARRRAALKRAADGEPAGEWLARFAQALEGRPDDWVLHAKCGQLLRETGKPEAAAAHYRAALERVPHAGQVRRDLAVALALAGALDEAVSELRRSGSRLYRTRGQALGALGAALLKQGRTDAACAALEAARRDEPRRLSLANNLGLGLLQAGRAAEAEAQFRTVSAAAPEYGPAHGNLGICLARQGRAEEAHAELTRAAELCPADADVQANLGLLFLQSGRPQAALAPLRRAVALQPDSFAAHNNLGYVLSLLGQPEAAAQSYRESLAFAPGQARVELNLADALLATGRAGEALERGRQALLHATRAAESELAETIRSRLRAYAAAAAD
jgi:tetratricopeptide (TPR) repeat protein